MYLDVYGPYTRKDNRKHVVLVFDDRNRGTVSYPRWLLLMNGKYFEDTDTVDHVDDDFTNDDLGNLQILSRGDNIRKSVKPAEVYRFKCPICNKKASKSAAIVRHNRKMGKVGPFCSRSCAGKYGQRIQAGVT